LLPSLIHKVTLINSTAQFIIVIEKDATFQHLLEENVFDALGSCILITVSNIIFRFIYFKIYIHY